MKKLDRVLEIKEVDAQRREDCEHYDKCLNIASAAQWASFSCNGCATYESSGRKDVESHVYRRQPEDFRSGESLLGDASFGDAPKRVR